ncbi:MAG: metalloregulator ArsR/SmtB family transcription factor [Erysipelotrichaceae bacterium]|nr:metalloregulator ArsR/SmtB family transcription factor [Erysipelotrichaceae bacterium]MDD3924377.1 metalloregulator ArsR/SmtB family transcription factor [Erysipelotrichaceae bacterium]MDD4643267.1 metalloregulator ArsR/SmtB family transcription factor [Erysipelotrichaceae bacterium]
MIDHQEYIRVFKAFCDPKRIAIIDLLQNGEHCACVIAERIDVSQSALSYHMKLLVESGIVENKEVGKWMHYRLNKEGLDYAQRLLASLVINDNYEIVQQCNIRK